MTGSTDDALLEALGEIARAEGDGLDARWDALAAGSLSAEDEAALKALAATAPDGDAIWAAFAPRDAALDDAITASVLGQAARPARPPAPVVSITEAPSARRRWAWAGAAIALAAGLLVFVLRSPPALPPYSLENHAGEQVVRGEQNAKEVVYGAGSQLDLILRPAADLTTAVAIRVFHARGDTISALPVEPTRSDSGAFRLRGAVDELLPKTVGAQTLIFIIGAPKALPKSVDALKAGLLNGADAWQVLQHEYRRR